LGVCGWVRNTEDGRVEIVAEGERRKLIKLIELVRKGPPLAKVEKVDVSWGEATWEFQNFSIVNSV
ncbi:MAG: acylphosphatase, partial [Candidatus Blackburnbacteria bacterium]|nr:acylphosphatase [Candidatus Blackburnbacteria bacterium]